MGFSLALFFEELKRILSADCKASTRIGRLKHAIDEAERYAIQCGDLPRKRRVKK